MQASVLQQNYVAPPPPPPPPLESILSTKYNFLQSYPLTQICSSLQKPYIGSELQTNQSYEATNSRSTAITKLPSEGLQKSEHDIFQPYTVETPTFENVSPIREGGQSWTKAKGDETIEGLATRTTKKKMQQPKVRGLTLLRKSVAVYAKELLKPKWQEGIMTKEAFKTITKKTVDKVIGTVKANHVPNTNEKVTSYMKVARPKIFKLVQVFIPQLSIL